MKALAPKVIGPVWHSELDSCSVFDGEKLRSYSAIFLVPEASLAAIVPMAEGGLAPRASIDPFHVLYGYPPPNARASQNLLESQPPPMPALLWKPTLTMPLSTSNAQDHGTGAAMKLKKLAKTPATTLPPMSVDGHGGSMLSPSLAVSPLSPKRVLESRAEIGPEAGKEGGAVTDLTHTIKRTVRPLPVLIQNNTIVPYNFTSYSPIRPRPPSSPHAQSLPTPFPLHHPPGHAQQ